jgi:hypothetical protein
MAWKMCAAGLCTAVIVAVAVSPVLAQSDTQTNKRYAARTTRVAKAERPRARVRVEPRSFLAAGTEVLPGERKFMDYAFPPTYTPLGVVTNTGGRVGWHQSPLPGPFFPWGP